MVHRGGCNLPGGTATDDTIEGTEERDVIVGFAGGAGDDRLRSRNGADRLRGGPGDDDLGGGKGRDRCSGGAGKNRLRSCEH